VVVVVAAVGTHGVEIGAHALPGCDGGRQSQLTTLPQPSCSSTHALSAGIHHQTHAPSHTHGCGITGGVGL
jgi:hypothetical protein